jgi:hypothetical protein
VVIEQFHQAAPRTAAMHGDGALQFGGQGKLGKEDLLLGGKGFLVEGMVEADFADGGRMILQEALEGVDPLAGAVHDIPGMQAEGNPDGGEAGGDAGHGGPVGFAGAATHQGGDAGLGGAFHDGVEMRDQAVILQVAVGVEPVRRRCDGGGHDSFLQREFTSSIPYYTAGCGMGTAKLRRDTGCRAHPGVLATDVGITVLHTVRLLLNFLHP